MQWTKVAGQAFTMGVYMTAKCISLSWEAADQGKTYRFQDCNSKTSSLPILPQSQGIKLHVLITSLLLLTWQETSSTVQQEKYLREKQLLENKQNTTGHHRSHSLRKKSSIINITIKQRYEECYRALFSTFLHLLLSQSFGTQVPRKSGTSIFVCSGRAQGIWEQRHWDVRKINLNAAHCHCSDAQVFTWISTNCLCPPFPLSSGRWCYTNGYLHESQPRSAQVSPDLNLACVDHTTAKRHPLPSRCPYSILLNISLMGFWHLD